MWKLTKAIKILVGSPVCQKPEILNAFLNSLKYLNHPDFILDYMFVDDNKDLKSKQILNNFKQSGSKVTIIPSEETSTYHCNEESHHWSDNLMLRVAEFKNSIIRIALEQEYDALFFADSDLILNPELLIHLQKMDKDIISEIFWTRWHPGKALEPNVWLFDEYDLVPKQLGQTLDEDENEDQMLDKQNQFLMQLKVPGVYEVGGLGACTLISRKALLTGVNFSPIYNLTIHGEDRFFCIRAAVLGIQLYVDTFYPAYHIYREKDLAGVETYLKAEKQRAISGLGFHHKKRITLSMVVRNESGRYLKQMLASVVGHIDEAVIIDDSSDDDTVKICEELLADIPLTMIKNEKSMFSNEVDLRKKQWLETIRLCPDWILNLDADEILEESFWNDFRRMAQDIGYDSYGFRLYDMWNEMEYREDRFWNAHTRYRVFMLRYQPGMTYSWKESAQHCGRFPVRKEPLLEWKSEYRIKHYGWATPKDRLLKYERYRQLDPDAIYGIKEQYDSILDQHPYLKVWK